MYPRNLDAEKILKLSSRSAPKLCEIKRSTTRHKYITSVATQKNNSTKHTLDKKKMQANESVTLLEKTDVMLP